MIESRKAVLEWEDSIKQVIKDNLSDKIIEDLVLNPESGRLLFYYWDKYTSRTGKTSKKRFELGVLVLDHEWLDAFEQHGITVDLFILYLIELLNDCNLSYGDTLEPITEYGFVTGMESYVFPPNKRIDLWLDTQDEQWLRLCYEEGFADALAERIVEITNQSSLPFSQLFKRGE